MDKEALPCNISTVFVPPGTLCFCEEVSPILCDGARKHLLPTIYGRREEQYDGQEVRYLLLLTIAREFYLVLEVQSF
jgi:hypothetical protein